MTDVPQTAGRGGRVGAWGVFAAALVGGLVLNTAVGAEKLSNNYATRVAPALDYVGESERDVVVVSHQWVAQELEALFGQKHFLRVNDPSEMPVLAAALAEHGHDGFLFLWARYDDSPGEPQVVFEDEHVRVSGPLIGRLGWNFDVYECVTEPTSTPAARE